MLVATHSTNPVILTRLRISWIQRQTHLVLIIHALSTITQAQSTVACRVLIPTKRSLGNLTRIFQRVMVGHLACHERKFKSNTLRGLLTKVQRKLLHRRQLHTRKTLPLEKQVSITQWERSCIATEIEWTNSIVITMTLRRSYQVLGSTPTSRVLEKVRYHQLWARLSSFRYLKLKTGLNHRQWSNITLALALTHRRHR